MPEKIEDKPKYVTIAEAMERNARRMTDYSKATNPKGDDDLLGVGKVGVASAQSGTATLAGSGTPPSSTPPKPDPDAAPQGVSVENNPDVANPVPVPEQQSEGDGTGDGVPASPNAG